MNLKILLPYRVFTQKSDVSRIVAETGNGSTGLLPHRLDCIAALVPGILLYTTPADGTVYVAVDEGVLVKAAMRCWSRCVTPLAAPIFVNSMLPYRANFW
jgi:F-type H+-transporting ATPase subunit epsilon